MKKHWFKELGWIYTPISWQGWLITLVIVLFCLHIFIVIDGQSHSISDTLYGIFPYIVPSLLVLYLVASKTSKK